MGRPKRYASEAEKMKAYRERKKSGRGDVGPLAKAKPFEPGTPQTESSVGSDSPPARRLTAAPVLAEPTITEASCGEARESTSLQPDARAKATTSRLVRTSEPKSDSRGGSQLSEVRMKKEEGIPEREWKYAVERAARAKRYAVTFGLQGLWGITGSVELRFQDPMWQWENEVKGRFGGIIGGSLSGTRGEGGRPQLVVNNETG